MIFALVVLIVITAVMCGLQALADATPRPVPIVVVRESRILIGAKHRAVGRATRRSTRELRRAVAAGTALQLLGVRPAVAAALAATPPRQGRYDVLATRALAAQAYADRKAIALTRSPWGTPAQRDVWSSSELDLAGVT